MRIHIACESGSSTFERNSRTFSTARGVTVTITPETIAALGGPPEEHVTLDGPLEAELLDRLGDPRVELVPVVVERDHAARGEPARPGAEGVDRERLLVRAVHEDEVGRGVARRGAALAAGLAQLDPVAHPRQLEVALALGPDRSEEHTSELQSPCNLF